MSYFELYQENPSLFLIVLLISFVATIFVYGAFPFIFAKTTKKSITKKKYKRLCYGLNIIGMVFFVFLNGAVSGGPYFLWTWIFSNYGVKTLNSRGLLKDNEQPNGLNNGELENNSYESVEKSTEKLQQNPDLDMDKMSPQEAAEYLIAEQLGKKYIPEEKQDKKIKIKYCSQCGSQIDPVTKKCTGCGKQYFRGVKFNKCSIAVIALTLVIATLSILCVSQYKNIQELNKENSDLETQVKNKQSTIDSLQSQVWDNEELVDFVDDYVVFVEDDGTNYYHKYECYRFKGDYFWAFNLNAARDKGYKACPYCH